MSRLIAVTLFACVGCGGPSPAPPPACDQACADGVALRGLRSLMKLGFNTLQGKPAGMQDAMTPCPVGGMGHIHGNIVTNATVGTMDVDMTYDLVGCRYLTVPTVDPTPEHDFDLTMTGTITEIGTLSAQPTSTTSLLFRSSGMTFSGNVYHPELAYEQSNCVLAFGQNGNAVAGTACGRPAGFNF